VISSDALFVKKAYSSGVKLYRFVEKAYSCGVELYRLLRKHIVAVFVYAYLTIYDCCLWWGFGEVE
jgi:hypothetical protein